MNSKETMDEYIHNLVKQNTGITVNDDGSVVMDVDIAAIARKLIDDGHLPDMPDLPKADA